MSSSDPIIICSTAGTEFGDKDITVYDADILSLAVKLSEIKLATIVGAHDARHFVGMVNKDYEKWHRWLTDHGVPNVEHVPHPQNFP